MSYQWDNKKPTAQMLGRWQPFHDGHYALFEEIITPFKLLFSTNGFFMLFGVGFLKNQDKSAPHHN